MGESRDGRDMSPTKVMLVDDHELIRLGLRQLFSDEEDMEVVAEAETCAEALEQARASNPHVIIMDISLKDCSGIDATEQILSQNPEIKILGLSMHNNLVYVRKMLEAGASGYVTKDTMAEAVVTAVRRVMADHIYLSPEHLPCV
jgi:two-component system invasion response regulator UvrY